LETISSRFLFYLREFLILLIVFGYEISENTVLSTEEFWVYHRFAIGPRALAGIDVMQLHLNHSGLFEISAQQMLYYFDDPLNHELLLVGS